MEEDCFTKYLCLINEQKLIDVIIDLTKCDKIYRRIPITHYALFWVFSFYSFYLGLLYTMCFARVFGILHQFFAFLGFSTVVTLVVK